MKVAIIGGGIIGLSSAWFLSEAGHEVTVIDRTDMQNNCSYGNAGYVCPSHFVPLATPGIVQQGLKWMWNPESPFYVQPRADWSLIQWGWKFMQMANEKQVEAAAAPLRDIALLSKYWYEQWDRLPDFSFAYEQKGLLEIFKTEKGKEKCAVLCNKAQALGLTDTVMLDSKQLQELESHTPLDALGALYFKCDAHLYPNQLMQQLLNLLHLKGVRLIKNEAVTDFETAGNKIISVKTEKAAYATDEVVLASGSWSRELAKKMNMNLLLMPGRGYSVTLENSPYSINHPSVLVEGRVALTPMDGNKIRFGGTMEITSTNTPPRMNRVKGILSAVQSVYTDFKIEMPAEEQIWYGYRPCSADGLPYIGRTRRWINLTLATGHSMIGLSLGAGTGKLVSEIINGNSPSMDISPFSPDRFA
ncbi:NAD(P)/FAD-dependent oxidoreductase [Sediminibacterium sp. TEGAF015]|uniref:NAD(P)/FAD-dependent oxidoreductase n=1 Tax=Sediminibacterium sp. TEGAF015 TaxID=575378 RepID=UPI0021F96BDC|nr:FAD-dependent oxidoreductase [Sediminibacterium sp. TEGAF015]BDQ11792.1 amino acid dehydrogenase [Sediminibacterium sp. TEGAF015]